MMLFLADVGVKVNRKILLCKTSGEDRENRRSPDPVATGSVAPLQKRGCRKSLPLGHPAISLPSFSSRWFAAALRDSREHLR
jgi:hypothetical protein